MTARSTQHLGQLAENALPAPPNSLVDWLTASIATSFEASDPIWACGESVLTGLQVSPDNVIRLAHEKLHTFPYQDVPACWRRLFEEASLHKVSELMKDVVAHAGIHCKQSSSPPQTDWVSDIVQILDRAAIISGLPLRRDIVQKILDALESVLYASCDRGEQDDQEPDLKRRKIESNPNARERQVEQLAADLPNNPIIEHPLPTKDNLSFDQFQEHLLANNNSPSPLVIKNTLSDWPALRQQSRSWSSPQYLLRKTLGGRRLVPVEFGRSYTDPGWGQRIITFGAFMNDCLITGKRRAGPVYSQGPRGEQAGLEPSSSDVAKSLGDIASDHISDGKVNVTGYLAQHDLLSQIPSLRSDILIPDYCYCTTPSTGATAESIPLTDEPFMNAWLGPGGTISPLHTDPYHNIFCQVVGFKYIKLYSPDQTPFLYPHGTDEQGVDMSNTSEVDLSFFRPRFEEHRNHSLTEPDVESRSSRIGQFPLFSKSQPLEGVLGPGDCLYIPRGWWHYVESLSTSFSVSFWWN